MGVLCRWASEQKSLDHPSVNNLTVQTILAVAAATTASGSRYRCFLKFGVWVTEPAHALHHWDWRNFPCMYLDWPTMLGWRRSLRWPLPTEGEDQHVTMLAVGDAVGEENS